MLLYVALLGQAAPNLNGAYALSRTPGQDPSKFPKSYAAYPGGADFFDVYSPPIRSQYSEVYWAPLAPVPLPADVVARFSGKGMAIVGFETDQVRKTPQGDVQVPINVAYNHHHDAYFTGRIVQARLARGGAGRQKNRDNEKGGTHWKPQEVDLRQGIVIVNLT